MFSGLRQNSVFYVLEKSDKPSLKVGQVVSVSNPMPKLGAVPYSTETFVDVSVKVGENNVEFKQLPSALSISNNGNVVVSDNREAMLNEIEGLKRISEDVLKTVNYHKNAITAYDDMLATLNPHIAEKKETDRRIGAMEERMGGIEGTLTQMMGMLSETLNKSPKTK